MSVRIELFKPHSSFTNLDFIEGRLFLSLLSPDAIAAITVKLEAESRSRLASDRGETQLEVHKVSKYSTLLACCSKSLTCP